MCWMLSYFFGLDLFLLFNALYLLYNVLDAQLFLWPRLVSLI